MEFSPDPEQVSCSDNWICARYTTTVECTGISPVLHGYLGLTVDLNGETFVDLASGHGHGCALGSLGTVRCFGTGIYGELISGEGLVWRFPEPGDEWPESKPGPHVKDLFADGNVTCAIYADKSVRCWGKGTGIVASSGATVDIGVLGQPNRTSLDNSALGDSTDELGDIPPIDLGTGLEVKSAATSGLHSCALLTNGRVKCWGLNDIGQLGPGHGSAQVVGDDESDMGDELPYSLID
jgi:alpha-tubulin suppressor-like RCC1 family protein